MWMKDRYTYISYRKTFYSNVKKFLFVGGLLHCMYITELDIIISLCGMYMYE